MGNLYIYQAEFKMCLPFLSFVIKYYNLYHFESNIPYSYEYIYYIPIFMINIEK